MRASVEIMNELIHAERNLEVLYRYQQDLNFGSRFYEDLVVEVKNTIQILRWVLNNENDYYEYKKNRSLENDFKY